MLIILVEIDCGYQMNSDESKGNEEIHLKIQFTLQYDVMVTGKK